MASNFLKRLAQLEARRSAADILIIHVEGGMPPDDPMVANAGALRWRQEPGEKVDAFAQRAEREARAAGQKFLVVGGLDMPTAW